MNFYSVIDQAIALLRQRGRVTYRALKRQFDLDDDVFEDLKAELITAQRLAVDEQGAVLVWVGETGTPPALQEDVPPYQESPPLPNVVPLRRNAASSPCCSVTWWTPLPSPASSTRKTCARWCGAIKRPAPR